MSKRKKHHPEFNAKMALEALNRPTSTRGQVKRLIEVRMSMTRRMRQGHEHLPLTLAIRKDVILHDRDPSSKIILVAKPLKNPL